MDTKYIMTHARKALCFFVAGVFLFSETVAWGREETFSTLAPPSALTREEFKKRFKARAIRLPHIALNRHIEREITKVGGFANLQQRPDTASCWDGRKINVIIAAVPDLFANTGDFAHLGLGKWKDKPVIYVDATFFHDEGKVRRCKEDIAAQERASDDIERRVGELVDPRVHRTIVRTEDGNEEFVFVYSIPVDGTFTITIEKDGEEAGYVDVKGNHNLLNAYIKRRDYIPSEADYSLFIKPEFRASYKGLGRTLMALALAVSKFHFKNDHFRVNYASMKIFYHSLGFVQDPDNPDGAVFDLLSTPLPKVGISRMTEGDEIVEHDFGEVDRWSGLAEEQAIPLPRLRDEFIRRNPELAIDMRDDFHRKSRWHREIDAMFNKYADLLDMDAIWRAYVESGYKLDGEDVDIVISAAPNARVADSEGALTGLVFNLHMAASEIADHGEADISDIVDKVRQIDPSVAEELSAGTDTRHIDAGRLEPVIDLLNRRLYLPANQFLFYVIEPVNIERLFIEPGTLEQQNYLGAPLYSCDVRFERPALQPQILTVNQRSFLNRPIIDRNAAAEYDAFWTDTGIDKDTYCTDIYSTVIRYYGFRHSKNFVYTCLKLSILTTKLHDVKVVAHEILKPDNYFRSEDGHENTYHDAILAELGLDLPDAEKADLFANSAVVLEANLGAVIDTMAEHMDSGRDDLAHITFMKFVTLLWRIASRPQATGLDHLLGARILRLMLQDRGIDTFEELTERITAGDAPAPVNGINLLRDLYSDLFYSDTDRSDMLADRDRPNTVRPDDIADPISDLKARVEAALNERRFEEAGAAIEEALQLFKRKEEVGSFGTNHEFLVGMLRILIDRIEMAGKEELEFIHAFFEGLRRRTDIFRKDAAAELAFALIDRRRAGEIGGANDIIGIFKIDNLMDGEALSRRERANLRQLHSEKGSGPVKDEAVVVKIFERLRKQILLEDDSTAAPNPPHRILFTAAVRDQDLQEVRNAIIADMPAADILRKRDGRLMLEQYQAELASTQPFFAVVIHKSGIPMKIVIKDKQKRGMLDNTSHVIGNRLFEAINAPHVWVTEGDRFVYVREITGFDMVDFLGDIGKYAREEGLMSKFFFALGIAIAEAHITGTTDRPHNFVVNIDKLREFQKEELVRVTNKAIVNIDRENVLTPRLLGLGAAEDTSEAVETFNRLMEWVLPEDAAIFRANMDNYLQGIRAGYREARAYFESGRDEVSTAIRVITQEAGCVQFNEAIIRRLSISDSDLDRLIANIEAGIERRAHYTGASGSPAECLMTLRDTPALLEAAREPLKGVSVAEVLPHRDGLAKRTVYREFEILKALGILVPVKGRRGHYRFADMMLGTDANYTRTVINVVCSEPSLHKGNIPKTTLTDEEMVERAEFAGNLTRTILRKESGGRKLYTCLSHAEFFRRILEMLGVPARVAYAEAHYCVILTATKDKYRADAYPEGGAFGDAENGEHGKELIGTLIVGPRDEYTWNYYSSFRPEGPSGNKFLQEAAEEMEPIAERNKSNIEEQVTRAGFGAGAVTRKGGRVGRATVRELIKMAVLHEINLKLKPAIPKGKILWHIIDLDIIPPGQASFPFASRFNRAAEKNGVSERLYILKSGQTIEKAMAKIRKDHPDAEVIFDAACASVENSDSIQDASVRRLVFANPAASFAQVEGIVAALRALHTDSAVQDLLKIYAAITGAAYKDVPPAIDMDAREFARRFIFNLPPAGAITSDIQKLNARMAEFLTAA